VQFSTASNTLRHFPSQRQENVSGDRAIPASPSSRTCSTSPGAGTCRCARCQLGTAAGPSRASIRAAEFPVRLQNQLLCLIRRLLRHEAGGDPEMPLAHQLREHAEVRCHRLRLTLGTFARACTAWAGLPALGRLDRAAIAHRSVPG
jgi:hypothetical protein